jgi:hypothetical protein
MVRTNTHYRVNPTIISIEHFIASVICEGGLSYFTFTSCLFVCLTIFIIIITTVLYFVIDSLLFFSRMDSELVLKINRIQCLIQYQSERIC